MKHLGKIVKELLVIIWLVISLILAYGVGGIIDALGGQDGAIFIGAAVFILAGFVPALALSATSVGHETPSYWKVDKYKDHPRNRRKSSKKRRVERAGRIKEIFEDWAHMSQIIYGILAFAFVPLAVSYYVDKWLISTFSILNKFNFLFIALVLLNYGIAYFIFDHFTFDNGFDKLKKSIRKAMGKEPLSINIPDYKKHPEFEGQLRAENFSNYVCLDGHESKHLKISESDKWICLCGEYYPIDLIYGRTNDEANFYTIKGDSFPPFGKNIPQKAREELYEFFKRRGNLIDIDPDVVRHLFWDLDYPKMYDMQKTNWAGLRLKWEEAVAQRKHPKVYGKNYKVVGKNGEINSELFWRVLSNSELGKIIAALNKKEIDPANVFNYGKYINEYTVCNAIKIAEGVRVNYKDETLDFLFKCLDDIDEAYFYRAVEVILRFPHQMIKERLEAQALLAYEAQDALHLAGLLYVAKEIDYEIKCLQNMKPATLSS